MSHAVYFEYAPGDLLRLDGASAPLVRVVALSASGERGDVHSYKVAWTYAGEYSEAWVEDWRLTEPDVPPAPTPPPAMPDLNDAIPF